RLTAAPADSLGAILGLDLKEVFDRGMMNPHDRYYGLNVQALGKYGSLELRYFPTAQNKEELIDWIKLAQSFKIAAVELGDIQAFQEVMANEESYTNFLAKYFEPWKDRILQAVPHYMALASYNKAMAITETYIYSNSNDTSYGSVDYGTIFTQGKYAGLV